MLQMISMNQNCIIKIKLQKHVLVNKKRQADSFRLEALSSAISSTGAGNHGKRSNQKPKLLSQQMTKTQNRFWWPSITYTNNKVITIPSEDSVENY